jgi:hypothetical protein
MSGAAERALPCSADSAANEATGRPAGCQGDADVPSVAKDRPVTARTETPVRTPGARREPRGLFARAPRRRASAGDHAPWCVQHGPSGCAGQVFSLPGTQLLVWLSAPSTDDPRLVVEGPDGVTQLPVQA